MSTSDRSLISLTRRELQVIAKALEEAQNSTPELGSGIDRAEIEKVRGAVAAVLGETSAVNEVADVWSDAGSVMVRAITVFGDPVELGEEQAAGFVAKVEEAMTNAK